MLIDGAHPNAAGEDFGVAGAGLGSAALKPAFLAHYGTQTWWPRTVYHRPATLVPDADTYTARVSATIDADLLKTGDRDGSDQRYTTYVRFDARNYAAPVRRALLNLYTSEENTSLPCEVVAVASRLSGGALWDESLTESDGNSLATLGTNALPTSADGYSWYSRSNADVAPKRPPQLILIETGIDEPAAYLERAVDSVVAERLR